MIMTEKIYLCTKAFPTDEQYGITSQMRRAAISVPSNIAEGRHRNSTADYCRFLCMAYASTKELLTQIEISRRLQYLQQNEFKILHSQVHEVSRMLYSLMKSLQ